MVGLAGSALGELRVLFSAYGLVEFSYVENSVSYENGTL